VIRRVCDDSPRPIREINPEVPVWLEAIIQRLMAKDPADRYQTATEVAEMLERCLAHVQHPLSVPLADDLIGAAAPAAKSRRRWRRRLAAGAGLCAIAAVALAILTSRASRQDIPAEREPQAVPAEPAAWPRAVQSRPSNDEIADQIREAWDLAGRIDAGLRERSERCGCDAVSTLSSELNREVQALESEIVSHPGGTSRNVPPVPRYEIDKRR
jgi:hypothetical protein